MAYRYFFSCVMLYEMTTGQKPFRGKDVRQFVPKFSTRAGAATPVESNIPAGVGSNDHDSAQQEPFLRYENCRELLDDLKNYRPVRAPKENAAPSMSPMAPRPAIREKVDKSYHAEMREFRVSTSFHIPDPWHAPNDSASERSCRDNVDEKPAQREGQLRWATTKARSRRRFSASQKSARLSCWRHARLTGHQNNHAPCSSQSDVTPASQENATSNQPQPMEADLSTEALIR